MLRHEVGEGFLPFEPLGLLSIQSALVKNNYNVKLYDCLMEHPEKTKYIKGKNLYHCGAEEKNIKKVIKKYNPDIIGISCLFFAQKDSFFHTADIAKQTAPNASVIVGGIFPSLQQEEILKENENIDIVVLGEGEETIIDLLNNFNNPSKVNGICYRKKNNTIMKTVPRKIQTNLDKLPLPYRDYSKKFNYSIYIGYQWSDTFNLKKIIKRFFYYKIVFLPLIRNLAAKYFNFAHKDKAKALLIPYAMIGTTRGCPNRCTFCSVHKFWKGAYRMRSKENVLKEIDDLVKNGIKELVIVDENFTVSRQRTIEICKEIIARKYNIRLTANSGIYIPSLDKEVLAYLHKAGLTILQLSVENGNQQFLNGTIKKQLNLEYAKTIFQYSKEIGLLTMGFFIFGYPGETKETMLDTLKYAFESGLDKARFSVLVPFPGTEVYQTAIDIGAIDEKIDVSQLRFTTDIPQVATKDFTKDDVKKIYDLANDILIKSNYSQVKDSLREILNW